MRRHDHWIFITRTPQGRGDDLYYHVDIDVGQAPTWQWTAGADASAWFRLAVRDCGVPCPTIPDVGPASEPKAIVGCSAGGEPPFDDGPAGAACALTGRQMGYSGLLPMCAQPAWSGLSWRRQREPTQHRLLRVGRAHLNAAPDRFDACNNSTPAVSDPHPR